MLCIAAIYRYLVIGDGSINKILNELGLATLKIFLSPSRHSRLLSPPWTTTNSPLLVVLLSIRNKFAEYSNCKPKV